MITTTTIKTDRGRIDRNNAYYYYASVRAQVIACLCVCLCVRVCVVFVSVCVDCYSCSRNQ